MKPGDTVYLKLDGRWFEYVVQRLQEFEESVTIQNGVGEFICRRSELMTQDAYLAMLEKEKAEERERQRPRAKSQLADVIEYWAAGMRTGKQMQAASGTGAAIGWTSRINAALRWGFIVKEKPDEPKPEAA